MVSDLGTSADVKTEILNIVGKSFIELEKSDKQKNQPILLLYGIPKKYVKKAISEK